MPTESSHADLDEYLADLTPSPLAFRRAFLLLLRLHFAGPYRAEPYDKFLQNYHYHPDQNQRTMDVHLMDLYDEANLRTSPAVYVGTGAMTMQPVGTIDNRVGREDDNSAVYYSNIAQCPVHIRHIAATVDEVYALAMQSTLFLSGMRPRIMNRLCLTNYQIAQAASDPKALKNAPERIFISESIIKLTWQPQWRSAIESLRIKKFSLQFLTESQ